MLKRCAGLLMLVWACWAGAALAQTTVRDDRGATLQLAAPPQRIVSLMPSLTESVCALGACARLVGTDRFSNWPAAVKALPKLGGLEDRADRSASSHSNPTWCWLRASARVIDRLEGLGLKVLVLDSATTPTCSAACSCWARCWATPHRANVSGPPSSAAWPRPPRVCRLRCAAQRCTSRSAAARMRPGAASFIGQTLARLGLANIVPAALGPFPMLNPEFVVRAQPDIVMAPARELAAMPARPGWAGLAALSGRSLRLRPRALRAAGASRAASGRSRSGARRLPGGGGGKMSAVPPSPTPCRAPRASTARGAARWCSGCWPPG